MRKEEAANSVSGIVTTADAELIANAKKWLKKNSGGKKPTINDVAHLAQVSKKTVSRIINQSPLVRDETRINVNAIIQTIGYAPDPQARGLAFRHSFLIGMVYDNPNPQYIVNMQQGILDGLRGTGYELVVHPCERTNANNVDDIKAFAERLKLFGSILTPSISENDDLAVALKDIGCACVRIASVPLGNPENMLVTNDRLGGLAAARHLLDLGHKNIGFLSGLTSFISSHERRSGFEEGLAERGLKLKRQNVFQGDYTFESGVACGEKLLSRKNPPTAIFAANDEMAAGLLNACRRFGRNAPGYISIVGYDDFQIATNVWPQLTTIHSPIREIGRQAAQKILASKHTDAPTIETKPITPSIIIRASSGPPRNESD